MNAFESRFWDGARESALTFHDAVVDRADVPRDVRDLARELLKAVGERKNAEFREALGVVLARPRRGGPSAGSPAASATV